jgi:molybdenum cofactor synthesis domain-containing protein
MRLRIGILTISDSVSAGRMEDAGGLAVADAVRDTEWEIEQQATLPDEREQIATVLRQWADDLRLDVVFTTGGTGLGPRDVTPEATLDAADRAVPGIAEAIRAASLTQTAMGMLSRGVSAQRGATLIVNLPGSPRGAAEGMQVVRPVVEHAVAIMHGGRH